MRKMLFALALAGGLALCWAQPDNADYDPYDPESAYVNDIDDEEEDGDTLDAAVIAANIAAAREFTPEELSSPMMTISEAKTAKGNDSTGLFDWCLNHLFISGILSLIIAGGGTWLVYRSGSYLFITLKKS